MDNVYQVTLGGSGDSGLGEAWSERGLHIKRMGCMRICCMVQEKLGKTGVRA